MMMIRHALRPCASLGGAAALAFGAPSPSAAAAVAQIQTPASPPADPQSAAPAAVAEITVVAAKAGGEPAVSRPVGANAYVLKIGDWGDVLTGSNPLALLKTMPGASYTSTDAFGLDESDASLFVRGFHMNEMAVLFEGIPLNDVSFATLTGTTVLNVGVPDDIAAVQLGPGSAKESAFSSSDNGGEIRYALAVPKDVPSGSISQSYGSNDALITSVSAQTGQIGEAGPKVLFGFQRAFKDKYEGGGTQYMLRGDLKVEQDLPWGDVNLFFSASHAEIWGYDDLSFDMIKRLGWSADYLYPNYQRAYEIDLPQNADAVCAAYACGELAKLLPYDSGQTSTDEIGSIAQKFRLSSALSGGVSLYGAANATSASLSDPTTPSLTGAPFSEEVWRPHLSRFGGVAELKYAAGPHTLSAGLWEERSDSAADTAWFNEPRLGQGAPLLAIGPYDVYGAAFQSANLSRWRTLSRQVYLHDDYALSDRLNLGLGFKAVDFATVGGGVGPDHAPFGALSARNDFLPHLSAFWRPDPRTDVFMDAAETESGYRVSPRGEIGYSASPWTVSNQATFDAVVRSLHPESDWNVTFGAARRFAAVSLTYDVYCSLIANRLLSASVGTLYAPMNTVGAIPRSQIVGTDLGIAAKLAEHFHFYQGLALSRFRYDDDLTVAGQTMAIKGKAQPGYPMISLVSDLSFKFRAFDIEATSAAYLDQPFSYTNDLYGPSYWLVTAHAAYALPSRGRRPALSFRLNVDNLLNRKNIGTLGVDGFPFSGDYQTLQRSAPRQLLFTVSAKY